ncbi:MAG: pyrimidine reductase family protein [Mycobacterium sp.]
MTVTTGHVDDVEQLAEHYRDAPRGVRANMIFSADGAAAFGGRAGPLSCPVDQQLLTALRGFADVVLVGAGTARAESYGPVRGTGEPQDVPPIAVVSTTGNLPATIFGGAGPPPILVTSAHAVDRHQLDNDGRWQLLVAGDVTVDLGDAIRQLKSQGKERILCEGGPTLLDALVESDLIDEICVTIAPRLAGGQPVGTRTQARLASPTALQIRHVMQHNDYLFLKYGR